MLKIISLILLILLSIGLIAFGGWWLWQVTHPAALASPFIASEKLIAPTQLSTPPPATTSAEFQVWGYLPFWLAKKYQSPPVLTDIAFFSLTLDETGRALQKRGSATDPGYRWVSSDDFQTILTTERAERRTHLVITVLENEIIENLLSSPTAQGIAVQTIQSAISEYQVDGVNIDIEYAGETQPEMRTQMTEFMRATHTMVESLEDPVTLSLAVYPSSISGNQLWSIPDLSPLVDYFVVMTYDFHRASSSVAGAVSPLHGETEATKDKHITHYIADFVKVVPSGKILLGVPFYGYEWQTTDAKPRASTFPRTGLTASFERIQLLLADHPTDLQYVWDPDSLTPFLIFSENEETKIISYEDAQSLALKLELVRSARLGGIAIWALGYEGDSSALWETIAEFP